MDGNGPPLSEGNSQEISRHIIVNGDDFGLSQGINQAILMAHEQGILTSASLMVTGPACEQAVAIAKAHPQLGVGLHLVLVCGRAVLPPATIPHLVNPQGDFSTNPVVAGLRYQFSSAARQELQLEIRAQLEKFCQTGLPLSHVDGHLHLHCHPVVLEILIELAAEFGIQMIRLPWEELALSFKPSYRNGLAQWIGWWVFSQLRRYGEPRLRAAGIRCAERIYGLLRTGQITEPYLLELIPQIQADFVEIYAHPALPPTDPHSNLSLSTGEIELAALCSAKVRQALRDHGWKLVNFRTREAIAQS